jgi:D-xylose transport system substrate-binding protein
MKRKPVLAAGVGAAALALVASGCSSNSSSGSTSTSKPLIGIILPDEVTSPRWANADQPALQAQCTKDGLQCDIQNAEDSDTNEVTIGTTMINVEHVQVLMVAGVDPAPTETITNLAHKNGVKVIDYDRAYGDPDYYMSFNGVTVGVDQGKALLAAIAAQHITNPDVAVLDGSPTDGNATEFKQGYLSVLNPLFANGTLHKSAEQAVTGWSNPLAATDFQSMYAQDPHINVIMVANDGMADAIIPFLQQQNIAGKVVVSGQDASALGLQDILLGYQSFTIYKASSLEAVPAVDLAKELVDGTTNPTGVDGQKFVSQKYSTTTNSVPSILATPETITLANVDVPVKSNYTPFSTVCTTAQLQQLCTTNGVVNPSGS